MGTMTIPTPRYEIGQAVFVVSKNVVHDNWPCPDCHDTREWSATSPAGETLRMQCPRCSGGSLYVRTVPTLGRARSVAAARQLTIASVRIDTAPHAYSEPVEYMCAETGVGSGTVWRESHLFATEAEALVAAEAENKIEQAKLDAQPPALRAADYASFPIRAALGRDWSDQLWNSWYLSREYREAMESIIDAGREHKCECDPVTTLEEAQERLSDALRERSWHAPHPVDALMTAARAALPSLTGEAHASLASALAACAYQPPDCDRCELPQAVDAVDPVSRVTTG